MITQEKEVGVINGWAALFAMFVTGLIVLAAYIYAIFELMEERWILFVAMNIVFTIWCVCLRGFFTLQPNESAVLILFGKYKGTTRQQGWCFANPFYTRRKISLRIRNFTSDKLKVNDLRGNPIEIASVVVWRVADTAKAVFDVDDFVHFVDIQSEAAVRHLAMSYSYDIFDGDEKSLRGNPDEVSEALKQEIQERISKAGIYIDEARLSHLAYAPEIAGAMLQRQQAEAIVAARAKIVEGAVGMVEHALELLEGSDQVNLDEERRASMVSNLLVVLCGHDSVQPVVNTGTLYN
jgi:regulator of protease activity HflC (stomatin/prohibitin superfamily)